MSVTLAQHPRVLDLFCGAGGAAMGYHKAGYDVIGVDNVEKHARNYPFEFVHADALEYAANHAHEFDLIHASPPCQGYSPHVTGKNKDNPRLIEPLRELLAGHRYVIENVLGAWFALQDPIVLCGTMFGLPLSRHRLFEISPRILETPEHPPCVGVSTAFAIENGHDPKSVRIGGSGRRAGTQMLWAEMMGINWYMTIRETAEAIPPAYTEYIGRALLDS
jgi:DNA (cytosine-5)-methyltransferase 1